MIKNIIFDLDGVLFDGCEFHAEIFMRAVNIIKPGLNLTKEYHDKVLNGMTTKQKLKLLNLTTSECDDISELKQRLTREVILNYIMPSEEQKAMLQALYYMKYKIYCVSNSIRTTVETCLACLEILEYFSGIISNEDTTEPKPSAQPYLTAYSKWELDPKESVIVEDSPHGVQSARSSGGNVLVVAGVEEVTLKRVLDFIESVE
jgi:HAD superfamily hydrolase (TIGR01509 family)